MEFNNHKYLEKFPTFPYFPAFLKSILNFDRNFKIYSPLFIMKI